MLKEHPPNLQARNKRKKILPNKSKKYQDFIQCFKQNQQKQQEKKN
jgi:hypothetical protein